MEYFLAFNSNSNVAYADDGKNGWTDISHMWSAENSLSSEATYSSPPSSTSPSSYASTSSGFANPKPGRIRQTSTVSPAVSSWSEGHGISPITPKQRGSWQSSLPIGMTTGSFAHSNFASVPWMFEDRNEDHLWMPKDWQLPLLPSVCPQTPARCPGVAEPPSDDCVLPLMPQTHNPSLSRQIFAEPTCSPVSGQPSASRADWSSAATWSTPQTITPTAVVHSLLPSSPISRVEMSSPLRGEVIGQPFLGVDSSPPPVPSPRVIPSQSDVHFFQDVTPNDTFQPMLLRRTTDRRLRRSHQQKQLTPMVGRPRRSSNQVVCDLVIPENTFACTFPGCRDRATNKPKRFRRQEHKKRHETTVHNPEKKFVCWVPDCARGFTRTDNLKNHVIKTHGKNNPAQRNRYVATLDPASQHYNPEWEGALTDDGFPLIPEVSLHRCQFSECGRLFHLEDKLKAHLIQNHGRKTPELDSMSSTVSDEDGQCHNEGQRKRAARRSPSAL